MSLHDSGSGGGGGGGGLGFSRSGSGGGGGGGGLGVPRGYTRTERVRAALAGRVLDRVPVCFWHHFKPECSGRRLA